MNKLAFTLIEILIVIVVIGIISSFIIVSISSITQKATIAKGQAFSTSIKNSLMSNLISEWRLDETSGTSVSDQWGTNTGTWNGAGGGSYTSPSWRTSSECVSQGCLAFDGTDDYISIPDSTPLDITGSAISFSFWIKPAVLSGWQNIINKKYDSGTAGYTVKLDNDEIKFDWNDTGNPANYAVSTAVNLVAGQWQQIVVTSNSQGVYFYKNGSFVELIPKTVSIVAGANNLSVGTYASLIIQFFSGSMDDIRIYNTAISTSRIEQNYYSGLNRLFKNKNIGLEDYQQRIFANK